MKRALLLILSLPINLLAAGPSGLGGTPLSASITSNNIISALGYVPSSGGGSATNVGLTGFGVIQVSTNGLGADFNVKLNTNETIKLVEANVLVTNANGLMLSNIENVVQVFTNGFIKLPSGTITSAGTTTSGIQEALNAVTGTGTPVMLAGNYTITSKITIPTNGILASVPGNSTIINRITTANNAAAIVFRDNSAAIGLTVTNALMDTVSQNCYGVMNGTGDTCATNFSIINCVGYGDDDDIHFVHTNALTGIRIEGGTFYSKFDCIAIGGAGNPAHTITIKNCRIYANGPAVHSPNSGANAVNITGSSSTKLSVYDSFLLATNKSSAIAVGVNVNGAAVNLYGTTTIITGIGAGSKPFNFQGNGETLTNNGGWFDPQAYQGDIVVGPTFSVYPLCQVFTNIYTPFDPNFSDPSHFTIIVNDANQTYTNYFLGNGNFAIDPLGIYYGNGAGLTNIGGNTVNISFSTGLTAVTNSGKVTVTSAIPPSGVQALRVTTDVSKNTTNTPVTISDLTFIVTSGHHYIIDGFLVFTNLGGGDSIDGMYVLFDGGNATKTTFNMVGIFGSQNGGGNLPLVNSASAYDNVALTTRYPRDDQFDTSGNNAGYTVSVLANNIMEFHGLLTPSSTGTFIPRFNLIDTFGTAVPTIKLKAGSHMTLTETAN